MFEKKVTSPPATEGIFLAKAKEWLAIGSLFRRYGVSTIVVDGNAQAYETAAKTNQIPHTPFADAIVQQDIAETIQNGKGVIESAFDIPVYQELENKKQAERWATQMKLEAEKRKAEAAQREIELKKQRRAALAEELGIPLAKLE